MRNRRLSTKVLPPAMFLLGVATAAQATPCGTAIDKMQAAVDARLDAIARRGPESAETRAARMHYQPTPASIAAAERRLHESEGATHALAALLHARKANRAGNAIACERALREAHEAMTH